MDDLRSLFNTLTGSHLEPLEQDIQLSDLTLEISRGRIALYGEVWVDGHQVAKAEVLVTVDGIRISGAVDDLHIGEEVHIKEAQLELIVGDIKKPEIDKNNQYRGTEEIDGSGKGKETLSTPPPPPANTEVAPTPQKKGTPVTAVIRGHVEVNTGDVHFKFKVAAAIMKKADGPVNYFVYGQLDCENLSIGKILGGDMEDGHPMDLQLSSVTLVAASHDKVNTQGLNASRFPVSKGQYFNLYFVFFSSFFLSFFPFNYYFLPPCLHISASLLLFYFTCRSYYIGIFLCAELSSVPFVGDLCKSSKPADRYILQAGYSSSSGLSMRVLLPENIRV
ncbi:hypothetical protein LI328DRAFT_162903 [Trichoderma asperelloides]|nr:hypothetical protein LI328DRAFT_162903 [Trichoderma asperelloides]